MEAKNIAENIVESKADKIKELSEKLMEKESLSHLDIVEILGEKLIKSKEYEDFYNEEKRKKEK